MGLTRPYRAVLRRVGRTRWFAWVGQRVLTPLDKRVGRRLPTPTTLGTGLPMIFLTTTGRHSGEPRTSPLLYLHAGDDLVVVGTNYGGPSHPSWTYNLDAQPAATVSRPRSEPVPVTARRATAEEREAHWARFVEMWPGYEAYQARAPHREARMYVLEPAGRE